MTELPLEAATQDVIARYKRGNDMLTSAAVALRRIKERVEAGEAGVEWNWQKYRHHYFEQYVSLKWLNRQLQLAPPGATSEEVQQNADELRRKQRESAAKHRANKRNAVISVEGVSRNASASDDQTTFQALCVAWSEATPNAREWFMSEYGLRQRPSAA